MKQSVEQCAAAVRQFLRDYDTLLEDYMVIDQIVTIVVNIYQSLDEMVEVTSRVATIQGGWMTWIVTPQKVSVIYGHATYTKSAEPLARYVNLEEDIASIITQMTFSLLRWQMADVRD